MPNNNLMCSIVNPQHLTEALNPRPRLLLQLLSLLRSLTKLLECNKKNWQYLKEELASNI